MKACPFCAEQIQDAAIKCRFCGSALGGAHIGSTHPVVSEAHPQEMTLAEYQEAVIRIARDSTLSPSERTARISGLEREFRVNARTTEVEALARARRRNYRVLGMLLTIIIAGIGACLMLTPSGPPILRTAEGISVETCQRIQRRGCQTFNAADCAIDCTPTDASRRQYYEWLKAQQSR